MTLLELEQRGCLFKLGSRVTSTALNLSGTVRVLSLADVGEFTVRYRTKRFLTRQKAERLDGLFLKPGDILIARRPHPLGRACVFKALLGECVATDDLFIFRTVLENVDPRYLCYYLNSPKVREQISAFNTGSFRDRLSKEQIGSIKLTLPAIETQRTIASQIESIFMECDKAMEDIKKTNCSIAHYSESILRAAIKGQLVARNKASPSKHVALSLHANPSMPFEVPSTWKWAPLSALLVSSLHPCVDKTRPMTAESQTLGIDYIRANVFNFSPIESVKATRTSKTNLEPGDLLFYCASHKVNLKRCVVFKGNPTGVQGQHTVIRLRFDQKCIEPHFMAIMINAVFESQWFKASGQSMARITMRKLRTLPIPLPPYEEQIAVVAGLKSTLGVLKTPVDALLAQEKPLQALQEKVLNQFFKREPG
jgi:type I restriction enzyme S subunit